MVALPVCAGKAFLRGRISPTRPIEITMPPLHPDLLRLASVYANHVTRVATIGSAADRTGGIRLGRARGKQDCPILRTVSAHFGSIAFSETRSFPLADAYCTADIAEGGHWQKSRLAAIGEVAVTAHCFRLSYGVLSYIVISRPQSICV
jgi:hypothetical protein